MNKKHNYHMVENSPWPILVSFTVLFTALGGVMYMHFLNKGLTILLCSLALLVVMMNFWFRDVVREGTYLKEHSPEVMLAIKNFPYQNFKQESKIQISLAFLVIPTNNENYYIYILLALILVLVFFYKKILTKIKNFIKFIKKIGNRIFNKDFSIYIIICLLAIILGLLYPITTVSFKILKNYELLSIRGYETRLLLFAILYVLVSCILVVNVTKIINHYSKLSELEKAINFILIIMMLNYFIIFTRGIYVIFQYDYQWFDLIFVLTLPSNLIIIILVKYFLVNTEVLKQYSKYFIEIFFSVTAGQIYSVIIDNNISILLSIITIFFISIVIVTSIIITLDEINLAITQKLQELVHGLILLILFATLGNSVYITLLLSVILIFWYPFYVKLKLEYNQDQRNLVELRVLEVNLPNRIFSQTFYFNFFIRDIFNKIQSNLSNYGYYLIVIFLVNLFLIKNVNAFFSLLFLLNLINLEFTTKVTTNRVVINKNLEFVILKNLPTLQKRHMKRLIKNVTEYAVNNPVTTISTGAALVGIGVGCLGTVVMDYSTEVTKASIEATVASTEATVASTEATVASTEATTEARKDGNRQFAVTQLQNGTVTEEYKESLLKMISTGEYPETFANTLSTELDEKKTRSNVL